MKTALLKLQQMYKDGLIAQDFAVKEGSVANQDVAASKVGIFYGSFADPLVGIKDNYANNKDAEWVIMTPPSADGSKFISQASATPGDFIFVKKGSKNPEAVVKVVNLNFKLADSDPEHYGTGADGIEKHKYRFGCEMAHPWKNLEAYKAVSAAVASKDTSKLNGEQKGYYDKIVAGDKPFSGVFGSYSTFKVISEMKDNDQILVDAYQSLPTDTYVAKGETIKVSLDAALLGIIMGDDISNFDKAVDAWKKGGGDTITKEVNEWYTKSKK
jgi:putative aldouronate transport system substrate-binding protein